MLASPALDYHLLFGIELYRVATLAVLDSEETVLPSAERKIRHGRGHADVDSDISRRSLVAKTPRRRATRGEQRGLVSVSTAFQKRNSLVKVAGVNQAQHRPKDFGIRKCARRSDAIEDGRLHKTTFFPAGDLRMPPIEDNLGPVSFALPDHRLNPGFAPGCNHRPHLHVLIETVADTEPGRCFGDRIAKNGLCFADCDCHRNREAALTGASKGTVANDLSRHLHICIGKNDDVILRPALTLGTFAIRPRARVDVFGNGRGSD